jgi:type I restriction enzyme S subunit
MNYPVVQIGELALDEPGSFKIGPFGSSLKKDELVPSGIPVIAIENVLPNNFITIYRKFITDKKYQELSQYTVRPGDIVVTTMGTIGRAAVVPDNIGTAIIDSHLFRMRVDKTKVYPPFLCYAINGAPSVTSHLEQMSRGAIMDGLNTTILKESPIALPLLSEQKRIASLLARADRLRRLRRVGDDLSGSLLQSVFLEMFGEPTKNLKGWKKQKLESCCIQTVDCLHSTPNWTSSGVLCIRTSNLTMGGWNWSDTRYVSEQEYRERTIRSELYVSDIVLSREGTVGVAAIIYEGLKLCLGQRLVQVTTNQDIVKSEFLLHLLLYELAPERIQKVMAGSTSQHLNLQELRKMKIIVPPLPEQEQFAAVVQRVESLRRRQAESARQGEGLFQSLLAEVFG